MSSDSEREKTETPLPTNGKDNEIIDRLKISKSPTESTDIERSTSDEEKATSDPEKGQQNDLKKTTTNRSIAETLPLWKEILFVGTICSVQLLTQYQLGGPLAILHVIGNSFGVTNPGRLSWAIAGYSLTVGTFILLAGRMGDVFGYKRMLLIGYLWFALWTLVSGLAVYSNFVLFVFARVLAGIGPAITLTNGVAILGATYHPGRRKNMVFALFGATAPTGSILGATFSSLWSLAWWPWAFWTMAIGLVSMAFVGELVIPSPPRQVQKDCTFRELLVELDLLGGSVGVTALVLFNFAWNQAPIVGWQEAYVIVTLVLGIVLFAVFFYIEIKISPNPLIPFDILNSTVAFVLACISLGWSSFGIWLYYYWQLSEVIRHRSPLLVTAWISPAILSGTVASLTTGLLLNKIRPAWVMTIAMMCFLVGIVLMGTAPVDQIYWAQTFVAFLITPFGMDMSFPAATLILSNSVPKKRQGVAASLVNTILNYSISIGLGIAGTVEVHVNRGGATPPDVLFGYRAAFWTGMGLAGLGTFTSLVFLFKSYVSGRKAARSDPELNEKESS